MTLGMTGLVQISGAVLVLIALANLIVPSKLRYRENLARLSPIVRQVFILHSVYMVLIVLGFAALCLEFPADLAGGSALGRGLSGFLAIFWISRAVVQWVYIDKATKASNPFGNVAYTTATAAIGCVFALASIRGL